MVFAKNVFTYANLSLSAAETELSAKRSEDLFLKKPALQSLEQNFDYTLIGLPTIHGLLTINALVVAGGYFSVGQ